MYDYYDVQRLSYLAFDWPDQRAEQIGRLPGMSRDGKGFLPPPCMEELYWDIFGAESTAKGRALRAYLQAMRRHLREARRVLKPRGVAAYAVADSFSAGRKFPLAQALKELIEQSGFADTEMRERKQSSRRILPAGRDPVTGRFDSNAAPTLSEFIVSGVRTK
jgi:hypothetical protein